VRAAEYRKPVLRFVVLKGTPRFSGETEIVCTQIRGKATVSRDGAAWTAISQTGDSLRITTDVDTEHVFEVRCGTEAASPGKRQQ